MRVEYNRIYCNFVSILFSCKTWRQVSVISISLVSGYLSSLHYHLGLDLSSNSGGEKRSHLFRGRLQTDPEEVPWGRRDRVHQDDVQGDPCSVHYRLNSLTSFQWLVSSERDSWSDNIFQWVCSSTCAALTLTPPSSGPRSTSWTRGSSRRRTSWTWCRYTLSLFCCPV